MSSLTFETNSGDKSLKYESFHNLLERIKVSLIGSLKIGLYQIYWLRPTTTVELENTFSSILSHRRPSLLTMRLVLVSLGPFEATQVMYGHHALWAAFVLWNCHFHGPYNDWLIRSSQLPFEIASRTVASLSYICALTVFVSTVVITGASHLSMRWLSDDIDSRSRDDWVCSTVNFKWRRALLL